MSYIKTRNRLMDKCRERDSSGFAFHCGSARPPLELLRLLAIPSLRSSSNPLKEDCDAGRGIRAPLAPTTLGVGQPHWSSLAQTKASSLQFESPQRRLQCRERDSNPHGNYFPTDFKSVASAFPPSRLIDYFSVFLIFLLQVNFLLLNYYTTL